MNNSSKKIDTIEFLEKLKGHKIIADIGYPKLVFGNYEYVKSQIFKVVEIVAPGIKNFTWFTEYNQIVEYLVDSKGKSLILRGSTGVGKSLFVEKIIPALILAKYNIVVKYFHATEMTAKLIDINKFKYIVIDDLGTESKDTNYGVPKESFNDVLNLLEPNKKKLFITTNLSEKELYERYDERAFSRLIGNFVSIDINQKDMRIANR